MFLGTRESGGECSTSTCETSVEVPGVSGERPHPGCLAVEEAVDYVLVGEDRMLRDAVQEDLEHTLAPRYHGHVLLRF